MSFEYSTFPKSLDYPNDSTAYLSDLTADDWMKIRDYNQALIDDRVSDSDAILEKLDGKHITAKDINKIIDCIRAIETAYFNNTVKNNEIISNGDFNDMKTPGIYTMRASSANSPASEGKYYGLIVLKSDTVNFIEQIAFRESRYDVYIRYLNNSGWGEWRKINDGGNADTVDGKHASDLQDYNNLTNKPDFHILTNKTTFDIPEQGLYQVKCADNNSPNGKNGIWSLLVIGDGTGGYINMGNNYITQLAFYRDGMTYTRDCYMTDNEDDDTVYNWSEWRKINDGGNADTVDGKHASDFALKNHSHTNFSAWDSDSDSDTSWGVSISASGINFQWNDDINDSELHISENGLMGGGSFLPAISNFGNISAESFSGNGSNLTNVNADTISGKGINAIQTRDSGYCFYNQNKDWNDLTDTGYYGLMHSTSTALHNPVNGKFFYPMVFKYAADSLTQLAIPHSAGENKDFGEIYIRSKNSSNGWSGWKSVGGNGCIRTVSFTAPTGSNWYRIITNDGDICSGIFTISGGVSNYSSATVFSASQCYNGTVTGTAKLVKLSHAAFNSFITKIRLVKPSTDNYYIDIYASNSGTANLKVTFNGIGWKILDNITTANASAGFSYSEEITL